MSKASHNFDLMREMHELAVLAVALNAAKTKEVRRSLKKQIKDQLQKMIILLENKKA